MTSQTERARPAKPAGDGPDPIDVLVGMSVRKVRRQKGMSQETLANGIGLTFQQVQKYERGANRISCSMLYRIAATLEVAPTTFLPNIEDIVPASAIHALAVRSKLEDLTASYMRLGPSEQNAIRRLVRDLAPRVNDGDQAALEAS